MIEVTDPNILSQLNKTEVTDPGLLAQLNAPQDIKQPQMQAPAPTQQKENPLHSLAHSFPVNMILGGGDFLRNIPNELVGALRRGNQTAFQGAHDDLLADPNNGFNQLSNMFLQTKPTGEGPGYEAGKFLMNYGPIAAPAVNAFRATRLAKNIINELGGGIRTGENLVKSIANDVQTSGKAQKARAGAEYFDPVKQAVGDKFIETPVKEIKSKTPTLLRLSIPGKNKITEAKEEKEFAKYGASIPKFVNNYKKTPTLENAHEIVQQAGSEERYLNSLDKKKMLDPAGQKILKNVTETKDKYNTKIINFLNEQDPTGGLSNKWNEGNAFYYENVGPYHTSSMRPIVTGAEQNIKNIHTRFGYPEGNFIPGKGRTTIEDTQKILEHLPQETKNKILYSSIKGYSKKSQKPEELANRLFEAYENGYSQYFSPNVFNMMHQLPIRSATKKGAGKVVKYGLGALGLYNLPSYLKQFFEVPTLQGENH